MRYAFATTFALLVVGLAGAVPGEPSPMPPRFPAIPQPAACRVAPTTIDRLNAIAAAPTAAMPTNLAQVQADMSQDAMVDSETRALVTAALHELVACINANDDFRSLALYSDDGIRRVFGMAHLPYEWDPDLASLAELATPLPATDQSTLVWIGDPRPLSHRRVGAPVIIRRGVRSEEARLFVLVRHGKHFLVDDVLETGSGIGSPQPAP